MCITSMEKLSVDCYLALLDKPNVSLAVHQRRPESLNDAIIATLVIEAYLSLESQTNCCATSTTVSQA